jgi:sigma-B regulation protein RsbU (phosphoserine phosphatase)
MRNTKKHVSKLIRESSLGELVDVDVLQRVQDSFAETTGISVSIRDLTGRSVTRPSSQNEFCRLVGGTRHGRQCCRESNARAVRRAAREHRVVKYVCHAGLSQFAAPIEVEGVCVGTIVMGDRPEGQITPGRLAVLARRTGLPVRKLDESLASVKHWSDDEMTRAITLLVAVANGVAGLCYQGAELRGKLREVSALFEVSKMITSSLDLEQVLYLVAKSATEVANAKGCSIRLIDGKHLVIKSFFNLSERYINKGPVLVEKSAIDQAALRGEVVQMPDMLHDPRVLYPKDAEREGIRSGVSLGLISKKRPIGTLHLYSAEPRKLDEDEVEVLRLLANQAAVAIENAQLYQQSLEKRRLDKELRVAGRIQEQLLPEKPPEIAGFDIAAASRPCSQVGGDFYDFVPLGKGRMAVVIADVAGKGVPAALLMATARAGMRAHLEATTEPRQLNRRLNRNLCHDARSGQFVSLFCSVLNGKELTLLYSNAGHNPPLLLRGGVAQPLGKGGLVLGADEREPYEQEEVALRSGDLLFFYTDGITEALNSKDDLFGAKRLVSILRRAGKAGAREIISRVMDAVRQFSGGAGQSDDISLVVIRVE